METLHTEVLVVGGGTGGTAAALQAARRGVQVILVSEFNWLGGMLTSAGVTAPDGNELLAFQTGMWGAFLRELSQRQSGGLDNAWVSFFTYEPQVGAAIFADWVAELPTLKVMTGQTPEAVLKTNQTVTGVRFQDYTITAQIIIDGTELGDLLALAEIPHRWGWELQSEFNEPSAPTEWNALTKTYPVQAPTWVVVLQDYGETTAAPKISATNVDTIAPFTDAWKNYGGEKFLNYGRLPGDRFMINWPIHGNDYGEGAHRLIESAAARQVFHQEARDHSQNFAHYIQKNLGDRYGLATVFPSPTPAFALHPYYRESRRLIGLTTIREQDLLPIPKGCVAPLPIITTAQGCITVESTCDAIAIGNYANDHHYPSGDIPLAPKSIRWGGRWTGTPFTIPYRSLIPREIDHFLVCEKNISVSHMANGATRLQPVVLGIGQAVGMAAALCIEQQCQPRDLDVRSLQAALIHDPAAPAAVIPLFNVPPNHPDWRTWQHYYLDHPDAYPHSGNAPIAPWSSPLSANLQSFTGQFHAIAPQTYELHTPKIQAQLVTLDPGVNQQLADQLHNTTLTVLGRWNTSGNWILVDAIP